MDGLCPGPTGMVCERGPTGMVRTLNLFQNSLNSSGVRGRERGYYEGT